MGSKQSISQEILLLGRKGAGKTLFLFNSYLNQTHAKSTLGTLFSVLEK